MVFIKQGLIVKTIQSLESKISEILNKPLLRKNDVFSFRIETLRKIGCSL